MTERPPHVGRTLLWRAAVGGVLLALCAAITTATAVLLEVKDVSDVFHRVGHRAFFRPGTITLARAGEAQTILLAGSDHRHGHGRHDARSDTLMLLHIDPRVRQITALSIPRDLAVTVPGHGLEKINMTYGQGGLDLTTRTVERLLSFPGAPFRINHAVAATFRGFRDAVNYLRCAYVDVDRRYYHSNAGLPPSEQYSEINIQPGYQKLCGRTALAYVRYRHGDNDIVRAARQQEFVSDLKSQAVQQGVLSHLKGLVRIFARTTETDANLQSEIGLLRLIDLVVFSVHHSLVEIHFPATFVSATPLATTTGQPAVLAPAQVPGLGDYVTATPEQIQTAVRRFLHPREPGPPRHRGHGRRRRRSGRATPAQYGLVDARAAGTALVRPALAAHRLRFPFYAPAWLTAAGAYVPDAPNAPSPRIYRVVDRSGRRHQAYRLVIVQDAIMGQYYGVQGTAWGNPPIIAGRRPTRRLGRRTFILISDGAHLRLVAWRTRQGVYWVSNTLSLDLSNRQMLGIARSLARVHR